MISIQNGDNKDRTYQDDTIELLLEPGHGVLLVHTVLGTNASLPLLSLGHTSTGTTHHNVEVHAENTDGGVVSGTEIDMFLDTEAKVSSLGEVLAPQLVFLHLQASLQDLLSLGSPDCDVDSDLLVTSDTESADGVASF